MIFRKPSSSRFGLQPVARVSRISCAPSGWRDTARELARRLMPAMVLVVAAVLGFAAVAMA